MPQCRGDPKFVNVEVAVFVSAFDTVSVRELQVEFSNTGGDEVSPVVGVFPLRRLHRNWHGGVSPMTFLGDSALSYGRSSVKFSPVCNPALIFRKRYALNGLGCMPFEMRFQNVDAACGDNDVTVFDLAASRIRSKTRRSSSSRRALRPH